LLGLLKQLDNNSDINQCLYVYIQLIAIHPFADGNGRLARALFLQLMQQRYGRVYPMLMLIYLKNINFKNHHKMMKHYRQGDIQALKGFNQQAIDWSNQTMAWLYQLLGEYSASLKTSKRQVNKIIIINNNNKRCAPTDDVSITFHCQLGNSHIYINQGLLSCFNQFDYYLRAELRKHQFQ
jgi:fido (protein-threonine AMPylation protein)